MNVFRGVVITGATMLLVFCIIRFFSTSKITMRLLQKALTFGDVLLVPAYSDILPKDTSLTTRLTRNISLNIPLLSAAMDTVTEGRLAIAMAQEGGIGIIHKNLTAADPAREVATEIGRASCQERACQYVYTSVVAESVKKKKQDN